MKPTIIHPSLSDEFYTEERCHILEVFNQVDYAPFSIARTRVEKGVTTALHALKATDEVYYILSGEGLMQVDGQKLGAVGAGDVVVIPANDTQSITNTGETDLVFLCICSPRFTPTAYQDFESK